jgi:DNA-binding IclR family transcriptional regulator
MMQNSSMRHKVDDDAAPTSGGAKLVPGTVATLNVLRRLCTALGPLRLVEVAEPLRMNRSTVFNILRTLVHEGVVRFDGVAKTYAMTAYLADLVSGGDTGAVDRDVALREGMLRVAELYNVNVAQWRIRGDRLVMVAAAESDAEVKLTQASGRRIPLLYGAVGRAVAAAMPLSDDEIARRHRQTNWRRAQSLDALIGDVKTARRRGWADDGGSVLPGTTAVAVALRNAEGVVDGGCAALMFSGQFDATGEAAVAHALQQVAKGQR